MEPLFFGRVYNHWQKVKKMSHQQAETEVANQAKYFLKHKDYLYKKYG